MASQHDRHIAKVVAEEVLKCMWEERDESRQIQEELQREMMHDTPTRRRLQELRSLPESNDREGERRRTEEELWGLKLLAESIREELYTKWPWDRRRTEKELLGLKLLAESIEKEVRHRPHSSST